MTCIMATEVPQKEYGGYDHDFIATIPSRFICSICSKPFRDPHLAVCCGQHFCESCLNYWFEKHGKKSCPHCRAEGEKFQHVINKGLKSEVESLKIRCMHEKEGCVWQGEVGQVKGHLESEKGCGYVEVECTYLCYQYDTKRKKIKRKDLGTHMKTCPKRPHQCEHCGERGTYIYIIGRHYKYFCEEYPIPCPNECGTVGIKRGSMKIHRDKCPLTEIECPFRKAGCTSVVLRKDLNKHLTDSVVQHQMNLLDNMTIKFEILRSEVEVIQESGLNPSIVQSSLACMSTQLTQGRVSLNSRKKTITFRIAMPSMGNTTWDSEPFYFGDGYKMCINLKCTNDRYSISLMLLKAEDDDKLDWPIQDYCNISLTLVKQVFSSNRSLKMVVFKLCSNCTPVDCVPDGKEKQVISCTYIFLDREMLYVKFDSLVVTLEMFPCTCWS